MKILRLLLTALCLVTLGSVLTAGANGSAEPAPKNPLVVLQTSMGDIKIELYPDRAPITVKNFLEYARIGFYNGTIFHRVMRGFVIQGGGVTPDLKEKATRAPIKNEAANGLLNDRGTLSMAREEEPDTATAQFFINLVDNNRLNHHGSSNRAMGYAVFGKVMEGMDVVDKIGTTPTKAVNPEYANVPMTPIVLKSVKIISE
ncbi:MAG: peptidyl-prolyl cis-trans isomerase [Acidobacteriia bacterium]|nr:peptidyl-prolyl cis-trans isomerase [Terriglobia bacterium]